MFEASTIEEVEAALQYISADQRDDCVKVGQAIHDEFGEAGFLVWITWLQTAEGYNQKDMLSVWKSFKSGGGVTISTVFYMARQNGYVPSNIRRTLSPEEVEARKTEQQARQVEADKAQARKQYYAEKSLNKLIPELLPMGAPMVRYFFKRGLGLFKTPDSIMYHPNQEYWEDGQLLMNTLAIVSLITDINGNVESVHKIHITDDGHKANVPSPKKIATPIHTITGCSIKFDWPIDVLYLAEGLETALAVWLSTGKPTWCCLSTHGLETAQFPESVKTVYIMADKDRSGAGERSANKLAQRLIKEGLTAHILLPKQEIHAGKKSIDWLDIYNLEPAA